MFEYQLAAACLIGIVLGVLIFVVERYLKRDDYRHQDPDLLRPPGHWESVQATDGPDIIGYRVRWSEPDDQGRYLWVRHYLAGPNLSLSWCEHAASHDAEQFNKLGRHPSEWKEGADMVAGA